jgi:large subunit ribosomal protein L13
MERKADNKGKDAKTVQYDVYDAEGKVLGRLASTVAKQLSQGRTVAVVNASKAVISGNGNVIAARYKIRLNLKESENPEHSPYWSRRPDMLVKRIIRGMLPYRHPKGKAAYRRLRVFMGVPDELKASKPIELNMKDPNRIYTGYITVAELSNLLGYRVKE